MYSPGVSVGSSLRSVSGSANEMARGSPPMRMKMGAWRCLYSSSVVSRSRTSVPSAFADSSLAFWYV